MSSRQGSQSKYVYVDFKGYTPQLIKDTNRVSRQILESLEVSYNQEKLGTFEVLKKIYQKSIERMLQGTWKVFSEDQNKINEKIADYIEQRQKDNFDHLKQVVDYLFRLKGQRPYIVLDNADQLNEEAQREIYIYAQSLNKDLSAVLLLSLREGYFYKWRNKPPFDAFTSAVYHISAPHYREVLKKRFDYLIQHKQFSSVEGRYSNAAKIALSGDSVKHLFNNLADTIFGDQNSQVLAFLEETSYPNIRSGLEKLNGFLVSGHTKVLQYAVEKRYSIPIWEFFKAVAEMLIITITMSTVLSPIYFFLQRLRIVIF